MKRLTRFTVYLHTKPSVKWRSLVSKQFWIIIALTVLIFGGIFVVNSNKKAENSSTAKNSKGTEHIRGKNTAGVKLVEFGDYQCPGCGAFFPTVEQVVQKYGDQIAFQFKNFPLTSIHPNAFAAARAAEAAGMQGKFWEMNSLIYTNQSTWSEQSDATPIFAKYAEQLSLNMEQFKKDSGSTKVNDLINADLAIGAKKGVSATPTFLLNDEKIDVSNSVDSFSAKIDAAIAKQAQKTNATSKTQ